MTHLMQLLHLINTNRFVETYNYFPDVALSGGQFLNIEDIDQLLGEGYLEPASQDRFGAVLEVSSWAKSLLQNRLLELAA